MGKQTSLLQTEQVKSLQRNPLNTEVKLIFEPTLSMALAKLLKVPRISTNSVQLEFFAQTDERDEYKKSVRWSVDLEEIFYYFPDYPIEESLLISPERIQEINSFLAVEKESGMDVVKPFRPAGERIVQTLKERNAFVIQAGLQLLSKGLNGFRLLKKKEAEMMKLSRKKIIQRWDHGFQLFQKSEIYKEEESLDAEEDWV